VSTLSRTATDPDRIRALVTAHRHAQAEHRNALAAESTRALAAAARRGQVIVEALRRCGADGLAEQLLREAHAGTGLIVALTSDDADITEVQHAITAYLHHCDLVDHHDRRDTPGGDHGPAHRRAR